jgi:hypothetical protein
MTSLAYHTPPRALPLHLLREIAIVAVAFALLAGGIALGMSLNGSNPAHTQSLVPGQTQTAP